MLDILKFHYLFTPPLLNLEFATLLVALRAKKPAKNPSAYLLFISYPFYNFSRHDFMQPRPAST